MNRQEVTEKVQQLMQDEQFKAKLEAAEDLDSIAELFQNEGIEVSADELEAAVEYFEKRKDNAELGEEDLSNVTGGIATVIIGIGIIIVGCGMLYGIIDGAVSGWNYCTSKKKSSKKGRR